MNLIFEGVFLFREILRPYWDIKIFADIEFETSLNRALKRDIYLFGDEKEIIKRYTEKYIPGQKFYLTTDNSKQYADIIIKNDDFTNPIISLS